MYATNVCRREGDVLLRTDTLEDELHTRVPLLLKKKTGVWGSSLKFAFLYECPQKMHFHVQQLHVMYRTLNNYRAARLCSRENLREPFGWATPPNISCFFKSDGQEISTIEWQELKDRFLSFFVHKELLGK